MKSIITSNKFILGEGVDGIYSDITIEIIRSEQSFLNRGANIQLKDEETLRVIEEELQKWIESYMKNEIYLGITILEVGVDLSGRRYKVDNSVSGVMHDALPKIGVEPPQIFGL